MQDDAGCRARAHIQNTRLPSNCRAMNVEPIRKRRPKWQWVSECVWCTQKSRQTKRTEKKTKLAKIDPVNWVQSKESDTQREVKGVEACSCKPKGAKCCYKLWYGSAGCALSTTTLQNWLATESLRVRIRLVNYLTAESLGFSLANEREG